MQSLTFANLTSYMNLNVTSGVVEVNDLINLYEVSRTTRASQIMVNKYLFYTVGILILLSNLPVVISSGLILKKGQQQKSTYLLLGNVSLADMIAGLSILFQVEVQNPESSNMQCVFQMGTLVCPAMVSIFSVGLIAVDRYIYILHGMHYQRLVNTTRVRIGIACVWILGIILGFFPATGWVNHELKTTRCLYFALFPGALVLLNSIISIIPIIVVAIIYSIILVRALRNVKEIKASIKTIKSNAPGKPEMRIYRGSGNLGKNVQSVKSFPKSTPIKIKRSVSFNADFHNKDETKNSAIFAQNSKSDDDFINTNDPRSSSDDIENDKYEIKVNFNSNVSICTQITNISGQISNIDLNDNDKSVAKETRRVEDNLKKKSKPKEPNKWRAITVVMLTSGSFMVTWMPYFITVIFFEFCEGKLTNPSCINIGTALSGPLASLAFLNSMLNPLIYAWWHKGFKRSLKAYFRTYIYKYINKNTNR